MVTRIEPIGDRILMRGGSLVTGDGRTFLECASIRIRKGLIADVMPGIQECVEGEAVLATSGSLMLPGFINGHAHATILGPSMPSGSQPLPSTEVEWQRN
jgi:cytosine/adenosine deaminase-related metal-dependent hydrolase